MSETIIEMVIDKPDEDTLSGTFWGCICRRCNLEFLIRRKQEQVWCPTCGRVDCPDWSFAEDEDDVADPE
jgi:hypothetical protein